MYTIQIHTNSDFFEIDNYRIAASLIEIAKSISSGSITLMKNGDWFEQH